MLAAATHVDPVRVGGSLGHRHNGPEPAVMTSHGGAGGGRAGVSVQAWVAVAVGVAPWPSTKSASTASVPARRLVSVIVHVMLFTWMTRVSSPGPLCTTAVTTASCPNALVTVAVSV